MGVVSLPDLRSAKRLLIIRLSSIGDVVHALPAAAALAASFPHLEITWVVEEMSADIVTGSPCLHDVIVIPRARWKKGRLRSPQVWREYLAFLADLRRRNFDVTLDLQGYAKTGLLALAAQAPYRFGWRRLKDGANLVSKALPHRPESLHRVEWYLDTARALGANVETVTFPMHIPDAARAHVTSLLQAGNIAADTPYAVLNPAVGNPARRWGAARYAQVAVKLAGELKIPSVLIGSGKDAALNQEVITLARAAAPELAAPLDFAGKTNLKELAAVLDGCAVHICGDTGSAHIAAALGTPVVAIYGPTDPTHAGVWGQSANILSRREFCAAGCSERQCAVPDDAGTAACLAAVTPDDVIRKVKQVLHERED